MLFMKGSINEILRQSRYFNANGNRHELTPDKFRIFMTHAENLMSLGLRGKIRVEYFWFVLTHTHTHS